MWNLRLSVSIACFQTRSLEDELALSKLNDCFSGDVPKLQRKYIESVITTVMNLEGPSLDVESHLHRLLVKFTSSEHKEKFDETIVKELAVILCLLKVPHCVSQPSEHQQLMDAIKEAAAPAASSLLELFTRFKKHSNILLDEARAALDMQTDSLRTLDVAARMSTTTNLLWKDFDAFKADLNTSVEIDSWWHGLSQDDVVFLTDSCDHIPDFAERLSDSALKLAEFACRVWHDAFALAGTQEEDLNVLESLIFQHAADLFSKVIALEIIAVPEGGDDKLKVARGALSFCSAWFVAVPHMKKVVAQESGKPHFFYSRLRVRFTIR